jgi:hypothetical protein
MDYENLEIQDLVTNGFSPCLFIVEKVENEFVTLSFLHLENEEFIKTRIENVMIVFKHNEYCGTC